MSNKKANSATAKSGNFTQTFRSYKTEMNEGEQAAFRQGAKTVENKVKDRLGFMPPKKDKK